MSERLTLELNQHEAANLQWLLAVAKRIGLDTGDWCGQLVFALRKYDISYEPNWPQYITDKWVAELRALRLSPADREALEFAKDCVMSVWHGCVATADDGCAPDPHWKDRALSVLSKLLGQGGEK